MARRRPVLDNRRVMRSRRSSTWFGVVLVAGLVLVAPAAYAQVPPELPPLPQPSFPPQTQTVFELIAPTVYPQCGTATVGVFLVRQYSDAFPDGLGHPPELQPLIDALPQSVKDYPYGAQVLTATNPVFAICGATPKPEQELTCLVDLQAQEAINTVTRQAGVPLPLGLHPGGDAVAQTIEVEDRLPPPAGGLGAGPLAAQFLVCAVDTQSAPPLGDYSEGPPSFPPPPTQPYQPPPLSPGSFPGFIAQPPVQLPPAPPATSPGATPLGDAVTYAVVWLLPLALLVYGGYFGGALTRELKLPAG